MNQRHALIIDDNAKNVHILVRLLNEQDSTTDRHHQSPLARRRLIGLEALDVGSSTSKCPASTALTCW